MTRTRPHSRRRGSILPIVALLIVALCGFAAVSVEIATLATVKLQCQNAADSAALAGARTLDGSTTPRTSLAQSNALAAASSNSAPGQDSSGRPALAPFTASEVTSTCGTYHYNTSTLAFSPAYTLQAGESYDLMKVSVQRLVHNSFFSVGAGSSNPGVDQTIVASAVATHRPRDIAVVLDFSGSMNNESNLWNCESYLGSYNNQSNNADTVVPAVGHYSSASAGLVAAASSLGGVSNITQPSQGMPALADSFTQSTRASGGSTAAFTAASNSYATQPAGDIPPYLNQSNAGSYARTLNELFGTNYTTTIPAAPKGSASRTASYNADYFENGYPADATKTYSQGNNPNTAWPNAAYPKAGYDELYSYLIPTYNVPAAPSGRNTLGLPAFSGYSQGPKYWGKTFFQWPPDPRPSADWRQLFFIDVTGKGYIDNTDLWYNTPQNIYGSGWGTLYHKVPYESWSGAVNYRINYKNILNWIKNTGPNAFPPVLRAGRILYYDQIPSDVPGSAYDPSQPNTSIGDPNQRFWKEYIDYCLGAWRDPFYGYNWWPGNASCALGPDFAWGNVQVSARPSGSPPNGRKLAYMNYNDNPPRPLHRMWFGPMTMMQFIIDSGLTPGTARDISTYSAKLGITSVLQDIQVNHPNDSVSVIIYNRPQYANEPTIGRFTKAQFDLNRDYTSMINALWYPPNSGSNDVRPWDANGTQTPSADFDIPANTATQHGLMLAYNQLSGSSTLRSAGSGNGGLGRVGAQRLVILETDGMANVNTSASFVNNGSPNSYYNVIPGQNFTSANYDQTSLLQVAQAICNDASGKAGTPNSIVSNPGLPGFATASKPVLIHTVAFGVVFQINSSVQSSAVTLLQDISAIGGSTFPSSPTDPANGYKWCIGPLSTRVQLLQQAFAKILDDGQAVSLVQ